MNVLHVVGNTIEGGNGIGRLIPEMIQMQNQYFLGMSSSLLLLQKQSLDFDCFFYEEVKKDEGFYKEYDLIIFHGLYFLRFPLIAKTLRKNKIPYCIKPHSSLVIEAQSKSFFKKKIANAFIFNSFLKNSSGILYTSTDERDHSIRDNDNSYIEHNGLRFNFSTFDSRLRGDRLKFVYLGRIDFNHKGLDYLIEAIKILKQHKVLDTIQFDFYGKGSKTDEERLKLFINQLNSNSVKFHGPAFGDEKNKALSRSDVFILTSRYEGVPMAILEAMSFSLPCLVTPGTNIGNVIKSNDTGWLSCLDAVDIASVIESVVACDPLKVVEKGRNAQKYVKENHSWSIVVAKSESIYSSIIMSSK